MDRDSTEPEVEGIPGERAKLWVEYHDAHAAKSTSAYGFVWDTTAEAAGPFCTDADGNVLMDFTSHVASTPLGYNNPRMREKLEEFGFTTPTKIAGHSFYAGSSSAPEDADVPGPSHLMDRLTDLTADYGLDTVFLSNTGAEAVENAIKICYDHTGGAKHGITFQGAFHGRTLGALSLNRSKAAHRRGYPEVAGVLDFPYCDDRTCEPSTCSCGFFPESDTADGDTASQLRDALGSGGYTDPDDVAYIVLEPVQGESGYRFPSDAFADEVQSVCDEHDILLVADEVQTGIGRTGEWWGCDHYAFEPDVITSAKALQVGATVSRREVFPDEKSRISSTWGAGDLVACAQGVATIEAIKEENLLKNARERGEELKKLLREETEDIDAVTDVRGKGLMIAVELDSKECLKTTVRSALENGLLTLGCGVSTLRLLPPLDVTEREIEMGARLLIDAVEQASEEAGDCSPTDPT